MKSGAKEAAPMYMLVLVVEQLWGNRLDFRDHWPCADGSWGVCTCVRGVGDGLEVTVTVIDAGGAPV